MVPPELQDGKIPIVWYNLGGSIANLVVGALFLLGYFLCADAVFVGVLLLILFSQIFYWPGAVQPGGVVLCIILYNTPVDQYVSYSLNRMLDTGIGVAMALVVAALLPKPRVLRFMEKINLYHPKPEELEENTKE